jgi:hypothetical protein
MDASERALTRRPWWSQIPDFLKLWFGLHIGGTVIFGLIDPISGWSWPRAAGGLVITFLLGISMLRHSKGGWFFAVLLTTISLLSAPGYFEDSPAYAVSGVAFSLVDLGILLSPQARSWVNQPTERKWTYTPKKQEEFLVRRCQNCGDTFPTSDLHPTCPSSGSTRIDLESEPML